LSIKYKNLFSISSAPAVWDSLLLPHAHQARAHCAGHQEAVGLLQILVYTLRATMLTDKKKLNCLWINTCIVEAGKNRLN